MVESGMNIKAIQYVMGHSKVNMTLDVYSHVDAEKAVAEFRKMIQWFYILYKNELSTSYKLDNFYYTSYYTTFSNLVWYNITEYKLDERTIKSGKKQEEEK